MRHNDFMFDLIFVHIPRLQRLHSVVSAPEDSLCRTLGINSKVGYPLIYKGDLGAIFLSGIILSNN